MNNIMRVVGTMLLFIIWVYANCYLGHIWNLDKPLWWQMPTFLFSLFGNMMIPFVLIANTIDNWSKRK